MQKGIKAILTLLVMALIGFGGIYIAFLYPKVKTLQNKALENSEIVNNAYFYIKIDNTVDLNYLDNSLYDFVIAPLDVVFNHTFNRHTIVDLTGDNDLSLDRLNSIANIDDRGELIGFMIKSSDLNSNLHKIKKLCNKNYCNYKHLTQILIHMDQDLSEDSLDFINNHTQSFALVYNNLLQSASIQESDITRFSIEDISCPNCNGIDWNTVSLIVRNANQYNIKYMLKFANLKYWYTFTQLPYVTASVKNDIVPIVTWEIYFHHRGVAQDAFAINVVDLQDDISIFTNNFPLEYSQYKNITQCQKQEINFLCKYYRTGKVFSTFTQHDLVPTAKLPIEGKVVLQIWTTLKYGDAEYKNIPVMPITTQYKIDIISQNDSSVNSQIKHIAWIPDWGFDTALSALENNPQYWDTLSPVWFEPQEDGELKILSNFNHQDFINICNQNSIKVVPSIALFDADVLGSILNNYLDQHVQNIVDIVLQYDYDGIDLDYEQVYFNDKDKLLEFIKKLSEKLHEHNKILSFTVLPKWGDDSNILYGYAPQTHMAQDWEAIGQYVDEFRIMSYDYNTASSTYPGAVAPYYWDKAILEYATQKMDNNKIILGIPLYGYDWTLDDYALNGMNMQIPPQDANQVLDVLSNYDPFSIYPRSLDLVTNGVSYTLDQESILLSNSYAQKFKDDFTKESIIIYITDNRWHYFRYLDKADINKRIELAKEYGIGGVGYWRLINVEY